MLLTRPLFLAIALLFCTGVSTRGHVCGPSNMQVNVGSIVIWNIEADLEEVQTLYTPISLGDTNIAIISPGRQFLAHDAYFAILGKKEGTTTFSYQWYYAGTGRGGICTVTVTVGPALPFTGLTSSTAISAVQLYLFSQYLSKQYIFTPQTLPPGAQYNPLTGQFYWIPNPIGFYIMSGLWAYPSIPSQTYPLMSHFLVSPLSSFRLDARYDCSSMEFCMGSPLYGPLTLERTVNLKDWSPIATYETTPDWRVRTSIGSAISEIYRTRLGAPAIQLGSEPETFRYPIPKHFGLDSRLYWSIDANDDGPSEFKGPLYPYNGRFIMPLDPQDLPTRGNIHFAIQDSMQTTPVLAQPFEKITGQPLNEAPILSWLPDSIMVPKNGQPLKLRFMITDDRTFPNLLEFHPLSFNPFLFPEYLMQANIDSDGHGELQIAANPNQSGSSSVELRFFDGSQVASKMLNVQIADNTPPNISRIPELYTPLNTPTRVVNFTVSDAETAASALTISATSSNKTVVSDGNISIQGTGSDRTLVVTPNAGATGSSTITVTVTDAGGLTDQTHFDVTVITSMRNYYDFNWDHKTDLVFQDDTGSIAAWYMNASVRIAETPLNPPTTGTKDWMCIGAGFFDNDRRGDLLFQHSDRTLATWHLDGVNMKFGKFLYPMKSDLDWVAVAVADLDRDRESDILFQRPDGQISAWLMKGTEQRSVINFAAQPIDNTWRLVGAGDFNADAYPDLVFQKNDGSLAVWYMKIADRIGVATFNPVTPEDAQDRVTAVTDLNNDGKTDLLFQKATGGAVRVWYMNGIDRTSTELLDTVPSGTWRLVGP